MRLRFVVPVAFVALALTASACGGGDSATSSSAKKLASQTAGSGGTVAVATPTIDPSSLGPAPVLGGNITSIVPTHGAKVAQSKTRSPNPQNPGGVCAVVTFDNLPENAQWFRMAFDGDEVTPKLTLIVASKEDPKGATMCYAPAEGFTVGRHSVALAVQDPRNPNAPTRQIVAWKFDVTP